MKKLMYVLMLSVLMSFAWGDLREHWRLDEGLGTKAYNSAGYKSGTLDGTTYTWQPTEGMGGGIYLGRNDRVVMPAIDIGSDWTVMGWVKPDTQPEILWARLFVSRHTDGFYVGLNNTNPQKWSILVNLSYGGKSYNGPVYTPNVWQHVACTYDSATQTATLYVDGTGNSVGSCAAPNSPNLPIFIGTDRLSSSPSVRGIYDDFAIYDRALTSSEINSIYQEGLAGKAINNWQAKDPSPANGAVEQPLDVTLSWSAGSNPPVPVTNYILFYGTDPQAVFDSNTPPLEPVGDTSVVTLPVDTTSYSPGFQADQKIYWRVDEKTNDPNYARGAVWSFETIKSVPVITQQPVKTRAFVGDSAGFTVTATSDTDMSYQWYKTGSGQISGATSNELTIDPVTEGDEGDYYVVITNSSGSTTSDSAALILKRLLGYWPMDGNADDVSGYDNHGVPVNGPAFVTGHIGSGAIQFVAASSQFVDVPNESHFDSYDAFTLSIFMKADQALQATWGSMFGKGGNHGGMYINRYVATEFACGHIDTNTDLTNADTFTYTAFKPVFDLNWHMVTFAFDGSQEYLYIDGVLEQQGPASQAAANDLAVSIGCFRNPTSPASYYHGLMDDVRIYNYALDAEEVAQLYYDSTGDPVCLTSLSGDADGDCVVDMEDLAVLAMEWLECNLFPVGCP